MEQIVEPERFEHVWNVFHMVFQMSSLRALTAFALLLSILNKDLKTASPKHYLYVSMPSTSLMQTGIYNNIYIIVYIYQLSADDKQTQQMDHFKLLILTFFVVKERPNTDHVHYLWRSCPLDAPWLCFWAMVMPSVFLEHGRLRCLVSTIGQINPARSDCRGDWPLKVTVLSDFYSRCRWLRLRSSTPDLNHRVLFLRNIFFPMGFETFCAASSLSAGWALGWRCWCTILAATAERLVLGTGQPFSAFSLLSASARSQVVQTAQTDCTDCADLTCQDGFADDAFAFAEQYVDFFQAKIEAEEINHKTTEKRDEPVWFS